MGTSALPKGPWPLKTVVDRLVKGLIGIGDLAWLVLLRAGHAPAAVSLGVPIIVLFRCGRIYLEVVE
jgi:hypothetical protein